MRTCSHCRRSFQPRSNRQRFCSPACRETSKVRERARATGVTTARCAGRLRGSSSRVGRLALVAECRSTRDRGVAVTPRVTGDRRVGDWVENQPNPRAVSVISVLMSFLPFFLRVSSSNSPAAVSLGSQ
jgi:hypothetical protein